MSASYMHLRNAQRLGNLQPHQLASKRINHRPGRLFQEYYHHSVCCWKVLRHYQHYFSCKMMSSEDDTFWELEVSISFVEQPMTMDDEMSLPTMMWEQNSPAVVSVIVSCSTPEYWRSTWLCSGPSLFYRTLPEPIVSIDNVPSWSKKTKKIRYLPFTQPSKQIMMSLASAFDIR